MTSEKYDGWLDVNSAYTEIDRLRAELADRDQRLSASVWREGQVQAEVNRLHTELRDANRNLEARWTGQPGVRRADAAEATLARVRELCEARRRRADRAEAAIDRVREYVETEMHFYAHGDDAAYRILRLLGRNES